MTARKRAKHDSEAITRQSDAFFRETLGAARVGTWTWDIETGEVVWSEEVERLFGLAPGSFPGTYEAYKQFQHPEDLRRVERAISDALATHSEYDIEHRVRRGDGSERWVQGRGRAAYDAEGTAVRMAGTVTDITEKKIATEHAARMQFSIDHAADAVFWHDRNARFIYVNERACQGLGYTSEELKQLTVHDIDVNTPLEIWDAFWAKLTSRRTLIVDSAHRRKDGTTFPVEVKLNYVDYDGYGFVSAFVRDVSERVRAEEERGRLEAQVLHAQKMESLGILAGGIAHDFNNLLVGILGSASLGAAELPSDSPVRKRFDVIQKAASRASDLAMQMLAYSGKGRFHVEKLDLSDLVAETKRLLEHAISKKATLELSLSSELPAVQGDATQIQQVVMNLITNGSDSLEGRSGTIRVVTEVVDASESYFRDAFVADDLPPGQYCVLEIRDDGSGIAPDAVHKIFDPFYTTKFAGRGLGLAAVLGIVRSHRGAIKLDSEPERGTCFRVYLPADGGPVEATLDKVDSPSTADESFTGRGTVLVVDDEEMVRNVAAIMLEKRGFDVVMAGDGREALDVFGRTDDVSLVLLDMTMPKMDGQETYHELRRIDSTVAIVISSGFGMQDASRRFRDDPPDGFVQKPYRVDELMRAVRRALENDC